MADTKITKAQNDGAARQNAIVALGLDQLAQVSNTEYATTVKNLEGNDTVVVVKVTVPKAQDTIDTMVQNYEAEKVEKAEAKAEKEAERAAKKSEKEATKKTKAVKTEEVEVTAENGDLSF